MALSLAIALGLFGSAFGVISFLVSMYLLVKFQALSQKDRKPEWEPLQTEELVENFEAGDATLPGEEEDYRV